MGTSSYRLGEADMNVCTSFISSSFLVKKFVVELTLVIQEEISQLVEF